MNKNILIISIFILTSNLNLCFGQQQEFNTQRHTLDKRLMTVLGSWAGLNILSSGVAWAMSDNQSNKAFHQMNVFWNTVNLGLAIPGYIIAKKGKTKLSILETIEEQRKTESVFLINAGVDLAYISSGILLRNREEQNIDKKSQFIGFGNSIILQGGFLLVFDWIAFAIHRKHARQNLNPLLKKIEPSAQGIGFILHL